MAEDKNSLPSRTPRRDPYRLTGETFGGRYHLEEFAGMGSFGAVYRTTDMRVGRTVAVKILKPDLGDDETEVARELFQREALTAGRLMHPHIVAVTDVGEESGFAYLVMEWLEGRTLEQELRTRIPFSPEETASLLAPISDALSAAHDAGVIHRDIKPSNIYIGRRDRPLVKVLDFGIAKVVTSATAATASRIAGTASYMSPEQITGSRIDRRTDIYSLGIVLYQMLTGELPFKGESQGHIIQQHIAVTPPSLAEARPDLPPALSQVIGRALGKLPEARQQSAQELYAEFAAALMSKAAPQSAHRGLPSHEQITEVMSQDVPPTVWAGQFAAPQPAPETVQQTIPVIGSTENILKSPAVSIATAERVPARLARPENVVNRKWSTIIFFAIAGAIVFPVLGILALRVLAHASFFTDYPLSPLLGLAFFGLLFGFSISALRWSKPVIYCTLGGAGVLLLLSILVPHLIPPSAYSINRRYLVILLHNMFTGAVLGLAICTLSLPVRTDQKVNSYLLSGSACAIIVLLFLYLYNLSWSVFYLVENMFNYFYFVSLGFSIGLLICGLRLLNKGSVR
jgi:serine/threonine protein kinase